MDSARSGAAGLCVDVDSIRIRDFSRDRKGSVAHMATSKKIPIKVMVVFGTRPEAIKMAPVCRSLLKRPDDFKTVVVLTAQHRAMLDQVMTLFHIKADHDLNVMQQNQTLEYVVTEVIEKVTPILKNKKPDIVLIHGDTVHTFSSSLPPFYHTITLVTHQ